MKKSPTYNSPLRREQAEQTRSRIVGAAVDLIVGGEEAVTMQGVADAAQVAVRTVFWHFSTREKLLDAVWKDMQDRLGEAPDLETLDDLTDFIPELFGRYGAMESQIRGAMFSQTLVTENVSRAHSQRAQKIRDAVAAQFNGGDQRSRAIATAVSYTLTVPLVSMVLKEAYGARSWPEAAQACTWAIRTLAAAYAENPEAVIEQA